LYQTFLKNISPIAPTSTNAFNLFHSTPSSGTRRSIAITSVRWRPSQTGLTSCTPLLAMIWSAM